MPKRIGKSNSCDCCLPVSAARALRYHILLLLLILASAGSAISSNCLANPTKTESATQGKTTPTPPNPTSPVHQTYQQSAAPRGAGRSEARKRTAEANAVQPTERLQTVHQTYQQSAAPRGAGRSEARKRASEANVVQPTERLQTVHQLDMRVMPDMNYPRKYLEKVIQEESRLLSQEPNNAHAYELRGLASWKLEDFASATRDLDKALALEPKGADAFLFRALAECYAEDNQHIKAINYFSQCVQRWPPSATWPLPSVVYLHRAESYAQLHKLPEALADADRVVASNKDQNWAYEFRARLHWSMGQYQKVVDDCTESIRLAPMATSSYVQRAKAYEKLGKSKLAARDRQKINELARTVDQ